MRLSNCLLKKKKSEIQRVFKFMKGQTEVTYNWKQPFCVSDSIIFLKNILIYNNGRSIQNIFSEIKTTTPTTKTRDKQQSKMSL